MRLLGNRSSLALFRKDLLHLQASLEADDNADIVALSGDVGACLTELYGERDAFETAENAVVITRAVRKKRDKGVDVMLVDLGSRSRIKNKALHGRLFPSLNPSDTGALPLEEQMHQNDRILSELKALDPANPIRLEYEAPLETNIGRVKTAIQSADSAELALELGRAKLRAYKTKADKLRLSTHAKLLLILGDKKAADSYFRPEFERDDRETEGDEGGAGAGETGVKPT